MKWSASQYTQFEDERTRAARDLLAQIPLKEAHHAIDLGCGPGNSTELLIERYGLKSVSGVDSDEDMLKAAQQRLPHTKFQKADLATWDPQRPADLLFANAVFQWLPNHLDVFERLMDHLVPGGVLAIQMPDNLNEPSHLLMQETASEGPWAALFEQKKVQRRSLLAPSVYYDRLAPKASHVEIWHTVYNHPLANAEAIVEWVKGSGLRRYLDCVDPLHREAFLADYQERIRKAYPSRVDGKVLLRFPRFFVVVTALLHNLPLSH